MHKIEIIGLAAAALTTGAYIPQVIKAWKFKSVKDISSSMYLAMILGVSLWLYYGIAINSISMILSNTFTLILALSVLVAKLKFKK